LYIVQTAGLLPASTLSAMNFQPHTDCKMYITETATNGTWTGRTTPSLILRTHTHTHIQHTNIPPGSNPWAVFALMEWWKRFYWNRSQWSNSSLQLSQTVERGEITCSGCRITA